MSLGKNLTVMAWILLLTTVYVGFCGYLGNIANKDYWMVRAFDADESMILRELILMYRNRTYEPTADPVSYWYGTLHQSLSLSALYFLEVFIQPETRDAVFILRFVNALAGGGIVILIFLMAKELMHS